jgi:hypothetical protein
MTISGDSVSSGAGGGGTQPAITRLAISSIAREPLKILATRGLLGCVAFVLSITPEFPEI